MVADWPVGPAPRRVEFPALSVSLECQAWGAAPTPNRPCLVLLHEGLGSVALWRGFPAALSAHTGLGVLAWSRAGHGHSDARPTPWTADYLSRDADTVVAPMLDRFGMDQAILVGHSDGGSVAAGYAGSAAGASDCRVRALVLLAPHFFTEPDQLASIRGIGETYRTTDLPQRMARHHRDADRLFFGWHDAWTSPEFAVAALQTRLPRIRCPVLGLQGADDEYGSAAQLKALDACAGPVSTCLIPACGHSPHLEKADETLAAISGFVGSVS